MTPIPVDPPADPELNKLIKRMSKCLCKVDPRYCINVNMTDAAPPDWIDYLHGTIPGGKTGMLTGYLTVNSDIYTAENLAFQGPSEFGMGALWVTIAHETTHIKQPIWARFWSQTFDQDWHDRIEAAARKFVDDNRAALDKCLKEGCQ